MNAVCEDRHPKVLDTELAYFARILRQLLDRDEGRFALIKGEELLGVFDTDQEAYQRGVELFGKEPFLVRQILRDEPTYECPALHVELIRGER